MDDLKRAGRPLTSSVNAGKDPVHRFNTRRRWVPPPGEQIRTLDTFNDEDRALEFLDKLIYAIGTETSQPGIGAPKNTDMSPFVLKEHSVTCPVSVYREDGTWVADWGSIIEACHSLGIRRNAAQDSLRGKTWCSCGYQVRDKGQPFRPHPAGQPGKRRRSPGGNHPANTPVWVYDLQGNFIAEYPTIGVCAAETGLLRACISSMIRGATHRSKSYCVRRTGVEWKPQVRKKYTKKKSA